MNLAIDEFENQCPPIGGETHVALLGDDRARRLPPLLFEDRDIGDLRRARIDLFNQQVVAGDAVLHHVRPQIQRRALTADIGHQ